MHNIYFSHVKKKRSSGKVEYVRPKILRIIVVEIKALEPYQCREIIHQKKIAGTNSVEALDCGQE